MGKKKINNAESRYSFRLQEFFVDKLLFKDGTLFFGSNARIDEVAKIIDISIEKAFKDSCLNKKQGNHHILDDEQIAELALKNNINFEKVDDISEVNVVEKIQTIMKNTDWIKRDSNIKIKEKPPVITIMGHVDHGKTTLLDVIRKSNLTSKEAGGITQTIGAYQIEVNGKKLTFIDTPGHEAFTEMRANGAKSTDIIVIVVAADDSIMPQTKESIDHAKAAGVPIIIAVNKIDTVGADFEKVKTDLAKLEVISEDWGGDVPFIPISALKEEGIDVLLKNILLTSELLELKAPENILGSGTVIESNIHAKKGNLVSIIVQNGILKIGDTVIMDDFIARVKAIHDDKGQPLKFATPGTPVELFGIGKTPLVGSKFVVAIDKDAQKIADAIHHDRLNRLRKNRIPSAADLFAQMSNAKKQFNIIIKTDALGVLEAITTKVGSMQTNDIEVKIIRKEVGEISLADVALADASNASIYTFNLKTTSQIEAMIKNRGIRIFEFDIIYKLFEDIEEKIYELTEEVFEEVEIGRAEVLQLFSFSKVGTIVGSVVRAGSIKRNSLIDVLRNEKIIFSSSIESLRVEKDQIKEVAKGREFAMVIKNLNIELKEGDILVAKELVKEK